MDLRLVFLGTAGAVPTIDRAPSGILLIRGGERLLFDCGEGTQRQLMRSVGFARIDRIFITHLHTDHFLGLPGLLKTMGLMGRTEPLDLHGPPGLEDIIQTSHRLFGRFPYPLRLHEAVSGVITVGDGYRVVGARSDHAIPGVAYKLEEESRPGRFHPEKAIELGVTPGPEFGRLQSGQSLVLPSGVVVEPEQVMDESRPGRIVVISGDTRPSPQIEALASGATVLVHDATFCESERVRAAETKHSTANEAAGVAVGAKVDLLVLTHISSRHSRRELLDEARRVFPRTVLPSDFDHLVVPFPEKGPPELLRGEAVGPGLGPDTLY